MAGSNDEIKALHKRLEKAEKSIEGLGETDLFIAKQIVRVLCVAEYTTAQLWLKGEDTRSFQRVWGERIEASIKGIEAAKTVKSVFEIACSFDSDLSEYIRAEKVKTAEEAMDIAHAFVKKYSSTALPMKATKEKDFWFVDIDVGALGTKIAKIKIDARTGDISSYEVPENQAKSENKKG